ncbi:predicted protein [Naegleria gruberi]|uniref:Predicted protein n=1 Tax=Naegleria gruberi TaxID=5762 RepID=D2VHE2_NAEGR|nr:uncharacterized protein NAEGRDRAFT_79943 [Naegleria gruberi]EFC43785.1 predicted protein [Naegleria gruberi]|eukprot:XP_002676529.1 predicted protein [Naegleria gruberi strain NEG-M]
MSIWGFEDILFLFISLICSLVLIRSFMRRRKKQQQRETSSTTIATTNNVHETSGLSSIITKPSPVDMMAGTATKKPKITRHYQDGHSFPHTASIIIMIIILCLSYSTILTIQCIYMGQAAYNMMNEDSYHSKEIILGFDASVRGLFSIAYLAQLVLSLNYFTILYKFSSRHLAHKIVFAAIGLLGCLNLSLNVVSHLFKILYTYFNIKFAGSGPATLLVEQISILVSASTSIFLSLIIALAAVLFAFVNNPNNMRRLRSRLILFIFLHQFVWIIYETYRIISQFDILFGIQLVSWPDLIMQSIMYLLLITYVLIVVITIALFNRGNEHQALLSTEWMALIEDEDDAEPTIFDFQAKSRAIHARPNMDQIPTHSLSPHSFNNMSESTYGAMGYNSMVGSLPIGMRKATPNTSLGFEASMYSTNPVNAQSSANNNRHSGNNQGRLNTSSSIIYNRSDNVPILKEEEPPKDTIYSSSLTSNNSSSSWTHKLN